MNKASSIVFTGDIGFDKYMDNKWEDKDIIGVVKKYNKTTLYSLIRPIEWQIHMHKTNRGSNIKSNLKEKIPSPKYIAKAII